MKLKEINKKTKTQTNKTTAGFILWEGFSPVDGSPIVAIATTGSKNEKTGDMIQTWIMRSDVEPHDAVKTGQDLAICGSCPVRGKGCYVRVHQAPLSIFRAYKKGNYPVAKPDQLPLIGASRMVRIGAYGDPAVVPFYVWKELVKNASGHTGYTHSIHLQPELSRLCMVSANNVQEARFYQSIGKRYFLAIDENEEIPSDLDAIPCPNYSHGVQCAECGLCNGGITGKSIVAPIHGAKKNQAKIQFNLGV